MVAHVLVIIPVCWPVILNTIFTIYIMMVRNAPQTPNQTFVWAKSNILLGFHLSYTNSGRNLAQWDSYVAQHTWVWDEERSYLSSVKLSGLWWFILDTANPTYPKCYNCNSLGLAFLGRRVGDFKVFNRGNVNSTLTSSSPSLSLPMLPAQPFFCVSLSFPQ